MHQMGLIFKPDKPQSKEETAKSRPGAAPPEGRRSATFHSIWAPLHLLSEKGLKRLSFLLLFLREGLVFCLTNSVTLAGLALFSAR
jgi:hypothetical protein